METKERYLNRDLSWLSFNHRVLQEAADPSVPLIERLRFLAIFSSNLDEFFRVRVALIRSMLSLKKKQVKDQEISPRELLKRIHRIVKKQQNEFGRIFREQIIRELNSQSIFILNENELTVKQQRFIRQYFREHVQPLMEPVIIDEETDAPFLRNKALYLAVQLIEKDSVNGEFRRTRKSNWAILNIPSEQLGRFIVLPDSRNRHAVMFLDDLVRQCLPLIFPRHDPLHSYSIKLTRDAELYIDDETSGDLVQKIKESLSQRNIGVPSRFLYDLQMPDGFLKFLRNSFDLTDDDLVPGGRYHNFNDFFSFPDFGKKALVYPKLKTLRIAKLDQAPLLFDRIAAADILLHYPYHSFDYAVRFFLEAAVDDEVESIAVTLYRVASDSLIVRALIEAAGRGKDITVFVEVKARFDEESNIFWARELEKAGARVLYSFPGLKVHAKLALVQRRAEGGQCSFAYLSTGNFNEKTARIYTDLGFFTCDERITDEVARIFDAFRANKVPEGHFEHLLVAQNNMRTVFEAKIDAEIHQARKGRKARIVAKMNSLEDRGMIDKLYEAGQAGVEVLLIIRGICCLVSGVKKLSKNIKAISIVGRFLEHTRIYMFYNGGKEQVYISSADWMSRNLNSRVEVALPIYRDDLRKEIRNLISLQRKDNVKARIINKLQNNRYVKTRSSKIVNAQRETFNYLKQLG